MAALVNSNRNINLDLIRFLGVVIIMVAHANPPVWLFELRNFGTPLLIIGSAATYSFIYREKPLINQRKFFIKRLKRLIVPAWIFLTFFFLTFYAAAVVLGKTFPFSSKSIINSYNFYNGIGFVWILKVYMILALLTPLGLKISKNKSIKNSTYFILVILLYLSYELLLYLFFDLIPIASRDLISNTILLIFPYSALYLYGLRIHVLKDRTLQLIILCSLLLFSFLAVTKYLDAGSYISTQEYKYPPSLYYIAYAFFAINLVYYTITRHLVLKSKRVTTAIVWLSANSLWIYLWHIMAFYLWITFINDLALNIHPYLMFVIQTSFLFLFGITLTYIQVNVVNAARYREKPKLQYILQFLR